MKFLFQLLLIFILPVFFTWFLFFTNIGNKVLFPIIEKSFSMYANRDMKIKTFNSLYGDLYFSLNPKFTDITSLHSLPINLIEIRFEYNLKCLNIQYQELGNSINMDQYIQKVLPEYSDILKLETSVNFSEPIYIHKQFCFNN